MLAKQNDPISKDKKINISPINYSELNKLAEDFGKHFVPQKELSAEQAFWLQFSNPLSEQLVVQTTPVRMKAPSELPKLSMVKISFQKLKNYLASFDKVVKVRTTPDAIIEGFDNGLHSEINEVKIVINQMKAVVEQCYADKRYFDIQKKEIFIDNDRLLQHIICQEVMNIVMYAVSVHVNVLSANNKCRVHDNLEIEGLEQENDHLFELLLSQDIVHIYVNSLATRNDCREMQQSYIHEYNENLVLKAELAKKNTCLKKHIESLKGKITIEKDATTNKTKVIAPIMFKLDLEPLSPKVLKNKDAHIYYIKKTQENVAILMGLVEHARSLRPLDSDLDSPYKYTKRILELLVYVTATCPSLTKPSEKLVAITPLKKTRKLGMKSYTSVSISQPSSNTNNNRISRTTSSNQNNRVEYHPRSVKSSSNKKNRIIEPACNANVKHSMLNANSELICATCNGCLFDAIHDSCVLDFVNDVNVQGNRCHLTRTTSTNVVSPKNPLPPKVAKKTPTSRNNPEMLKDVTNKSSSSCPNCSLVFRLLMLQAYDWKLLSTHQLHSQNSRSRAMASKQFSSGPGPQLLTPRTISSGLMPNPPSLTLYVPPRKKDWDTFFQLMFDKYFNPLPIVAFPVTTFVTPVPTDLTGSPFSTLVDQDAPYPSTSQTPQESQSLVSSPGVEEQFYDIEVAHLDNDPFFGVLIPEPNS
ncbi:hypothetical protein Tco_1335985 [Tanacetum coccineum]